MRKSEQELIERESERERVREREREKGRLYERMNWKKSEFRREK